MRVSLNKSPGLNLLQKLVHVIAPSSNGINEVHFIQGVGQ